MWRNYLKVAIRQLWRNKLFSILNVVGLATSMSVCLLLIMIIVNQYNFDSFHQKKEQIYRVISQINPLDEPLIKANDATAPVSLAEDLSEYGHLFEEIVPVRGIGGRLQVEDEFFTGEGLFVGDGFLRTFSFSLKSGDISSALTDPQSIILTEKTAQKFFGESSAMGREIVLAKAGVFIVRGVMENPPSNSHLQFEFLLPMKKYTSLNDEELQSLDTYDARSNNIKTQHLYVLLANKGLEKDFEEALNNIKNEYAQEFQSTHMLLTPQAIEDIVPSSDLRNEIGSALPVIIIYFLMILALIIIISAAFNYVNLSIARSLTRAKEVGLRKVSGANKLEIFSQFAGESVLLSIIALGVAVIFLELLIPAFASLGPVISDFVTLSHSFFIYLVFFAFAVLVGIIAGIFPAFHLASFQPIKVLRRFNQIKFSSKLSLRKVLITTQLTLSLALILITVTVLAQHNHVLKADLGIRVKNVANVFLDDLDYELFAQQVRQIKGVEEVSGSNMALLANTSSQALATFHQQTDSMNLAYAFVTPNFLRNMEVQLLAGNPFPEETSSTGGQLVILNEKAIDYMGYTTPEEAIGKSIVIDSTILTIHGVTKDFFQANIWFDPIRPFAFRYSPDNIAYANVKFQEANLEQSVAEMEKILYRLAPDQKVGFTFAEDQVYFLSRFFNAGSKVIGFVGFLAIVISCMGLLGMVIYTVEGKTQEIGIRKVLGAGIASVVWNLSRSYLVLLSIAIVISVPLIWFGADWWLQNFVIRISIGPAILSLGIGIMIIMGGLTIFSQTYWAAKANPIKSLRNE